MRVAAEEGFEHGRDFSVGTMIELPRACFVAGEIAAHADFFSFGTNDLTQTGARLLARRHRGPDHAALHGPRDPRALAVRDDRRGGRRRARRASRVERGRARAPGLEVGICGEHGGDPDSIRFFHAAGLDYVSCSPFRVPIARVAAAQATLEA